MVDKFDLMKLLSITGKYRGFAYLLDCVNLAIEDDDLLYPLKEKMYPLIAKKYGTSIACVERNIRTVIGVWWKSNKRASLGLEFDEDEPKPSNKAFITLLVARVQRIPPEDR